MAKIIFTDNPHNNEFITKDGKRWVHKSVQDKSVQETEYFIQRLLIQTGHVPYCESYTPDGFLEEFIEGDMYNSIPNPSEHQIRQIAQSLSQIHRFFLSDNTYNHFDNFIYKDKKYDPILVFDLIVGDSQEWVKSILNIDKAMFNLVELRTELEQVAYSLSIVHGDLSGNNIIFTKKDEVKFIDWTDCRIDVGISDVVQFFHLTNLVAELEDIFIQEYNSPLCFEEMIRTQKFFFNLYDLIYTKKTKGIIDSNSLNKITAFIDTL